MTILRGKRALEAISFHVLSPLRAIAPHLKEMGWFLINWDFEQGVCLTLGKKNRVLLFEFEMPDQTREAYCHTQYFNVQVRDPFAFGELSHEGQTVADVVITNIEKVFSILPRIDRPKISRKTEMREILVNRVLMPSSQVMALNW